MRFIKQEPVHPRYRMKRKVKLEPHDGVTFIKQVPMHPRDRMKRKRKIKLESYDQLAKKNKISDVNFVKQVPLHPRKRFERLAKIDTFHEQCTRDQTKKI